MTFTLPFSEKCTHNELLNKSTKLSKIQLEGIHEVEEAQGSLLLADLESQCCSWGFGETLDKWHS